MSGDHSLLRRQFTDLLDYRLGGRALSCSDQWFASHENLVQPDPPTYKPRHFVSTGQWMDGWETRRSYGRSARKLKHDWCVLRLGAPGVIKSFNIETIHFKGNAPQFASVDGAWKPHGSEENLDWFELLPISNIQADSPNFMNVDDEKPVTHVRLKIYPDGGVARLRAFGRAEIVRENYVENELVDLASASIGGLAQQCSDEFFSSPGNLLLSKPGTNMGDGWETKRRRDDGHDWCIIRLGVSGHIKKVIVDTSHFKGNFPDHFSLEALSSTHEKVESDNQGWQNVLPPTGLQSDREHIFVNEILPHECRNSSHIRLNIFPDGGVSRLRILGLPNFDFA